MTEARRCCICGRALGEADRPGLITSHGATICGACRGELEFGTRRAEEERPAGKDDADAEARRACRDERKLMAMLSDMQDDITSIRGWVLFMGIITLLGLIGTLAAIVRACCQI